MLFAKEWVKTQFKAISSDDLKKAYYLLGNSPPREPRCFGAVFRELSRDGLIFKKDFVVSEDPVCNCRPKQTWISREYKLRQKQNAASYDVGFNLFSI